MGGVFDRGPTPRVLRPLAGERPPQSLSLQTHKGGQNQAGWFLG